MAVRILRFLAPLLAVLMFALCGCTEPTPAVSETLSELKEVSESPDELSRLAESAAQESRDELSRIQESLIAESLVNESLIQESIIEESLVTESLVNESIYNESVAQESRVNESILNESLLEESRIAESKAEAHRREESRKEESRKEASRIAEESRMTEESIANDIAPVTVNKVYIVTNEPIKQSDYVAATIKLIDGSGKFETILDKNATIKIRGNSTSGAEKKPYNFKLDKKTSVFGLGESKKWCLLSNPYDKTLMRNKLAYDFALALGISYTSHSEYVDVYVNGKFMGNYLLTESVGVGEDRVDIDIASHDYLFEFEPWIGYSNLDAFRTPVYGILLGYNDRDYPTQDDLDYLNDFFKKAEDALHIRSYDEVSKYYDIDSFVDFYIVNEFFKNVDIGTSSTRFYIKDDMLYAGPVWDMDLSAGNCSATYYTAYNNVTSSGDSTKGIYYGAQWLSRLMQIPQFAKKVQTRYKEIQPLIENLTTDNSLGKNRIDRLVSRYGASFTANYDLAGWRLDKAYSDLDRIPDKTFAANVEYLRTWLIRRNEWLKNYWGIS